MRRSSRCALAIGAQLACTSAAIGQSATNVESMGALPIPWSITIRPSAADVAIGSCQLVYIDVMDDRAKDRARGPNGLRIGLADFDWIADGAQPNQAVGLYDGPNAWSVCACQGAVVGSPITITATYPAASLADKLRVQGLAFRSTAQLPIRASRGNSNPKGCNAPVAVAGVAIGTLTPAQLQSLPVTTPPRSARPVTTAPIAVVPTPSRDVAALPPAPAAPPPGPSPEFIDIRGTPAQAKITWVRPITYATPAPTGYIVERARQSDPTVILAQSPTLITRDWVDPLTLSGTWIYTVTALYADGRRGVSQRSYVYPEPQVPENVRAEQVGRDTVVVTWKPVVGASYYMVTGQPGNSTARADSAHATRSGVAVGNTAWQVQTVYAGTVAGAPKAISTIATATLTVVRRRYRVVAESFRVTAETVDQPLSGDGKFDEVYVAALGERLDRQSGALIDVSPVQVSAVHGDISSWQPPQRVKAGTASGWGGIHQGDVVSPVWSRPTAQAPLGAPQFVLWEGELIDGKHDLLLHPLLVEVDEPDYARARVIPEPYQVCGALLCLWYRYFIGPGTASRSLPAVKSAVASSQISVQPGVKVWMTPSGYLVHLEHMDRDRPIGLEIESNAEKYVGLVGMWRDKVVVLSREKIEAALASGQNKVEMRFWDHTNLTNTPPSTIDYLNGDYTLVMRLERAP